MGFILLDEVGDYIHQRPEATDGCRQHYMPVKHLCDGEHEYWTDVDYILNNDVWSVFGPIHPEFRDNHRPVDTDTDRSRSEP